MRMTPTLALALTLALNMAACSDDTTENGPDPIDVSVIDVGGDQRPDAPEADGASDTVEDDVETGQPDGSQDVESDGSEDTADDGDTALPDTDAATDPDLVSDLGESDTVESDTDADADADDDADGDDADATPDRNLDYDAFDTGGLVGCGARLGDTCSESEYCDFPDDLCGAADRPGVCRPRPTICRRDYVPTCGCDGAVHSNPCSGQASGTAANRLGGCTPPPEMTPCGSGFCPIGFSYCSIMVPGVPGAATSYSCTPYPDGCGEVPSCTCLGSGEACDCDAREDGGFAVTCYLP